MTLIRDSWYVIQVVVGREEHMCQLIRESIEHEELLMGERLSTGRLQNDGCDDESVMNAPAPIEAAEHVLPSTEANLRAGGGSSKRPVSPRLATDVFVPKIRIGKKQQGKWLLAEEVLLPGYLVVVTSRPEDVSRALRRIDGFARLLRQGDAFVPLSDAWRQWLEAQTQRGASAVGMSEGYISDGVLHVTNGPLLGMEAMVQRVNHRKKIAYLEFTANGKTVKAQVGLRITRRRR